MTMPDWLITTLIVYGVSAPTLALVLATIACFRIETHEARDSAHERYNDA